MEKIWQRQRSTSEDFLESNTAWVEVFAGVFTKKWFETSASNPQEPKMLWIGCSDSRVPESVIMGCRPGEVFVHRNIANQFPIGDVTSNAVLEFAVHRLKVSEVVVAGHSHCGGAMACFEVAAAGGKLPEWLKPLKSLQSWLASLLGLAGDPSVQGQPTQAEAHAKLTELSVRQQVKNVEEALAAMKDYSEQAKRVTVHGWVYKLETGEIDKII